MAEIELTTKYLDVYDQAEYDKNDNYDLTLDKDASYTDEEKAAIIAKLGGQVDARLDEKGDLVYTSNVTGETVKMDSYALAGVKDDYVTGSQGNDWINVNSGNDIVFTGEGYDMVSAGKGNDIIVAGTLASKKSSKTVEIAELSTEETKVYATLGTVGAEVFADAGNDVVYGSNGDDFIMAGAGNDVIYAGAGDDTVLGEAGDDVIIAGDGDDFIWGGAGNDTIDLLGDGDKTVRIMGENAGFEETIYKSDAGDKLQLKQGENGYQFNNLTFDRVRTFDEEGNLLADDLRINVADDTLANGTVWVDSYFKSNAPLDGIIDKNGTFSIYKDATINVGLVDGETYKASQYNESLSVAGAATVTGLTVNDKLDFSTKLSNQLHYNRTNNDLIVVDNEENSVTLKDYYKNPVAAVIVYDNGAGGTATKELTSIDSNDYTTVAITTEWDNLEFARPNGDWDLVVTDKTTKEVYTYEHYFSTVPFAEVVTVDEEVLVAHNIKNQAIIYVTGEHNFMGMDYHEHITVDYGNANSSLVMANAGNDTIIGGNKIDILMGGTGNDYIYGGNGGHDDEEGRDVLYGDDGNDHIYAAGIDAKGKLTYSKDAVTLNGGSGDDYLYGGKGNDNITGGKGNDTMTGNGGANTFNFVNSNEEVDTVDTIVDATAKDTLAFTGLVVDTALESTFTRDGDDLVIRAVNVYGEYAADKCNNDVVIENYFTTATKDRVDKFIVDGVEKKLSDYVVNEVEIIGGNGKYKGTDLNEVIDASEYVSPNGVKGVTITTGKGENTIAGSYFNDTVNASKAAKLEIEETAGVNKITSGNGDDVVVINEGYSSNTINVGNGDNEVTVSNYGVNKITAKNGDNTIVLNAGTNTVTLGKSTELGQNDITIVNGINKVTAGAGADIVEVTGGTNTIKLGNGESEVTLGNDDPETKVSVNNVTTGKDTDSFIITDGDNTVKSGAGHDIFTISGGVNKITAGNGGKEDGVLVGNSFQIVEGEADYNTNTITSGSAADEFTIAAGINTIKSGAGNDYFIIEGGRNEIDGGAGRDTYDLSTFAGDTIVSVTDKSGSSKLVFDEVLDVFFDITNVKAKTTIVGEEEVTVAKSFKIGKVLAYGDDAILRFTGKDAYSVNEIVVGEETYNITKANVNAVAQEVANWLAEEGYASTTEAVAAGAGEDLMAVFAANVDTYYGAEMI